MHRPYSTRGNGPPVMPHFAESHFAETLPLTLTLTLNLTLTQTLRRNGKTPGPPFWGSIILHFGG